MRLSIIIPVYNVEGYIKKTLQSLIKQTIKNFEVIIVDDGSTDNSIKEIEEVIKNTIEPNIKVVKKRNEGVSSARNVGLKKASGAYVLFLDGDDYISSDLVENIYRYIKNDEYDVITWGYDEVTEDGKIISHYFDKYKMNLTVMSGITAIKKILIEKSMWMWTGSIAYRKELIINNNLQYTIGCNNGEDQEFNFKVLARSNKVIFINKILSYYVQRKSSISNNSDLRKLDSIYALKRTLNYLDSIPKEEMVEIKKILKNDVIIGNYLYNLQLLINNTENLNIDLLLNQIEKKYPNLNFEIRNMMEAYDGSNIRLKYKIKLFLHFPRLYFLLVKINNKVLSSRKKRNKII